MTTAFRCWTFLRQATLNMRCDSTILGSANCSLGNAIGLRAVKCRSVVSPGLIGELQRLVLKEPSICADITMCRWPRGSSPDSFESDMKRGLMCGHFKAYTRARVRNQKKQHTPTNTKFADENTLKHNQYPTLSLPSTQFFNETQETPPYEKRSCTMRASRC